MRPNKDPRTEIILYGLLLIPLLFAAAALAQATEQAQGLAEITAVLSEILHTPSMLRWCASTPKFLLAVLMLYPLAVYCYMLDQADRHPGAEHGTAKWGNAHRLNIKYRNTKAPKENYILTENVRFSTDSHAHKHNLNIIVIGGSGSGKTRFYVKPNALQLIGSYLFLDPKGELTRTLGRIMETKGISVTVLDLVHFQGHYNPMAYLETDEDAIKLAFAIVNNTKPKDAPSGGDKFWDDSSVLLISALILYLMYEAPASEQNFSTLMDSYHRALIYILTAVPALRNNIDACFNFEKDEIKPESLAAGWQTNGTTKLTRFAYNLWNGYSDKSCTPYDLFDCSFAPYMYEAVKLRYPEYTRQLDDMVIDDVRN